MKITNNLRVFDWLVLDSDYGKIQDDRELLNFNPFEKEVLDCIEKLAKDDCYIRQFREGLLLIDLDVDHKSVVARAFDKDGKCIYYEIYKKERYNNLYTPIEEAIDLWFSAVNEDELYFSVYGELPLP